ncbi:Ig-like domain-containing protein, partial [Methanobrevibacter cuticularis]|uniref:Ig-like domain-containing protein n=1 Tax=Methanobrevibacter cuticularis TaxID=47311 RepID=UPI000AFF62AE
NALGNVTNNGDLSVTGENNNLGNLTNNGNADLGTNNNVDNVTNNGNAIIGGVIYYQSDLALSISISKNKVTITVIATNKLTGEKIVNATIKFYANGNLIGSAKTNENGTATFTYTAPNNGKYNILTKLEEYNTTNTTGNYTIEESNNTKNITINEPTPTPTPTPKPTPAKIKVYKKDTKSKTTKKYKIYYITYSIKNYGQTTGSKTLKKSLKKILKKYKLYKIQKTKNIKYSYNKKSKILKT